MDNFRQSLRPFTRNTLRLLAGTGILMFVSGTVQADVIEEIVVTAQKREESLQDVAVSVTAFSGDQMAELGLTSAIDLVSQTPGLQVSGSGGGSVNTFSVRGVTQNDFAASQESPVAVYVDEGYVSLNSITNFSLFDIERAEVLRGPQGTLFGRNATGGLVHYITKTPKQEFDGYVDVQLGEDGRKKVEGAVGGGLTDIVSGRVSAAWNKDNGLIDNDIGPDSMEQDDYSVRGQMLIEPSEDLSVLLKAQYADEDAARGGYAHTVGFAGEYATDPAATDFFGYRDADGDPFTVSQDVETFTKSEVLELAAHIDWTLGDFTFTSVTNYQDIEDSYGEDADVTPFDIYNYEQTNDVDQVSQELRMTWEGERTRNVIGFYYLNIDGKYGTRQTGDAFFGTGVGYPAGTAEVVAADQETETWAIFGQTEFDFTDQWSITLGIRYNSDDKDFSYNSTDIYFLQGGNVTFSDSLSEEDVSVKVQLNWRPVDDWLVYAGYSRGIKAGGFNLPLFPIAEGNFPFDGEVLNAYEIGLKSNLSDTVRFNAAAYYYDYDDYQAYSFDGFATFLFNANAETYGAEFELAATPIEGLDILLGLALLDADVKDVPLTISPTGKETAALAPDVTFNGLVRYEWPAFGGSLAVQTDFAWKDDHNFNLSFTPVIKEESYGVANARLAYTSGDESWSAAIFVRNFTDTDYRVYAFDTTAFFGSIEDIPGPDRWVGGNVSYHW
ncbi:MAG: TonB-dependent receptor [Gammaproteobacteria bacterium]|nr:TonB-dependent receptor [Gammaproteobacteria bacterium]